MTTRYQDIGTNGTEAYALATMTTIKNRRKQEQVGRNVKIEKEMQLFPCYFSDSVELSLVPEPVPFRVSL